MDFEENQSSSSSSSHPETVTAPNPKILTPTTTPSKHKKRAGRKIFKETRHPVYRGVRLKNGVKWVCEVREPNKKSRIWLGTFPEPEAAAVAHDVAALALRGDYAPLNFPDSAWCLPRAQSSSHQDIQRAAFQAARDFRPVSLLNACASSPSPSASLPTSRRQDKISETRNHVGFTCDHRQERVYEPNNSGLVGFLDEEAMFNMPVLLDSMAEGMLLTPLAMKKGFNWSHEADDGTELTLWG
ncbi:hypothetical protein Pfo_007345 [Paulownia fortunei]|nr:hypothetical protein Pfo_007345 [Paulownia fortunei]